MGATHMVLQEPQTRRYTRKEYYAMADIGLFANQRVELIEGEIVVMSPQNPPHGGRIRRLSNLFIRLVPSGFSVGVQLPLDLGLRSEPEPDISISIGSDDDFKEKHPTRAELVVEIANASVNYDQNKKGSLYAKAKIPEFWLVNLPEKCLEVYRDPTRAKGHYFGWKYAVCRIYNVGEVVSPLCMPGVKIAVRDVLP
jgi:Uma2 family endonuclease